MKGIYIHIPFCKQKCYYCDFVSYVGKEEMILEYRKALKEEIEQRSDKTETISTIYIGGGTPSLLEENIIQEIMQEIRKNYTIEEKAEITIEINPRNSDNRKIAKLQKNRN